MELSIHVFFQHLNHASVNIFHDLFFINECFHLNVSIYQINLNHKFVHIYQHLFFLVFFVIFSIQEIIWFIISIILTAILTYFSIYSLFLFLPWILCYTLHPFILKFLFFYCHFVSVFIHYQFIWWVFKIKIME